MATRSLWQRYQDYFLAYDDLGFSLDVNRMRFPGGFLEKMRPQVESLRRDERPRSRRHREPR